MCKCMMTEIQTESQDSQTLVQISNWHQVAFILLFTSQCIVLINYNLFKL